MVSDFDKHVAEQQVEWRKSNITTEEMGVQNSSKRLWILPENLWKEGLWNGIKDSLPEYLKKEEVQRHKGCHNLKSSQGFTYNYRIMTNHRKCGLLAEVAQTADYATTLICKVTVR